MIFLDLSPSTLKFDNLLLYCRHGKITEGDNVFKFLKSREVECELENDFEAWRRGEILYIVKDNKKREEINEKKIEEFDKENHANRKFTSMSKDITLDFDQPIPIPPDTPYTQTGYIPMKLEVKINAPVMLTQNHANKKIREDGISNGNRGFVSRIDFSKKPGEENMIEVIWVEFYDKSGLLHKQEMKRKRGLHNPDPYAVPILPISQTFTFEKNRVKYKRTGFPLILGFCHTAHKIQARNALT